MKVMALIERSDPIRRQLLGHATKAKSVCDPEDADVSLRAWLQEQCPAHARWRNLLPTSTSLLVS